MGFSKYFEHFQNKNYNLALEVYPEVEDSKIKEATIYKARIFVNIGKHKEALKIINGVLDQLDEARDANLLVIGRIVKSTILLRTHDNIIGLEFALNTKKILDGMKMESKSQVPSWTGTLLRTIGVFYDYRGQLENALDYYKESLHLEEVIGNLELMGHSHNNIGEIYRVKGQLELAIEHYKRSLELIGEKHVAEQSVVKTNLSIIYYMRGEIQQAIDLGNEVRKLDVSSSLAIDPILHADRLHYLIVYYISISKFEEARDLFKELNELSRKDANKFISEYTYLAEALILKSSARMKDKTKALLIFENLLEDRTNVRNHEIITTSLLSICEILIYELKSSNSKEVMLEIQNYLEDLVNISRTNQSYALIVNTLGLQAKLAIIQGDFSKAETMFQQAILTSEEFSLTNHLKLWENEQSDFMTELDKWKLLTEASATISERLTVSKFEKYLDSALKMAMGSK